MKDFSYYIEVLKSQILYNISKFIYRRNPHSEALRAVKDLDRRSALHIDVTYIPTSNISTYYSIMKDFSYYVEVLPSKSRIIYRSSSREETHTAKSFAQ